MAFRETERSALTRLKDAETYVENVITRLIPGFTNPDYDLLVLQELIAWRGSRDAG